MIDLAKNVKMTLIPTKKYKHITYVFKFVKPYVKKYHLAFNCLNDIIGEYSVAYPTKEIMASKKNMLYGNTVEAYRQLNYNTETLTYNYQFLNPKYAQDMTYLDQCEYIKETLFNPLFTEQLLEEFKRIYNARILRNFENPTTIAKQRMIEIIGEDNHLINTRMDRRDLLDDLNLDLLKEAYDFLINQSTIYIYVIGDIDESILTEEFKKFGFKDREFTEIETKKLTLKDYGQIVENKDISQSYLKVVYETTYSNIDDDYYKWMMTDAFLGLVPNSLLFNEIREKRSLCYSISSGLYKAEGLSVISSAISYKDVDEILHLTDECIQMLVEKRFSEQEFNSAKRYLINNLLSVKDDAKSYLNFLHNQAILHKEQTIEDIVKLIEDVNVEDVSEVAKTYQRRLVYVLRGNQDGNN